MDASAWRLATLLLVSTMTIMAGATISPALPAIRATLGEAANADLLARFVLTVPALFTALSAVAAGRLIDRFGKRGPLLWALVACGAAGAGGGLAPSIEWLLVTRAVLGLAVGVIMTTSVTLVGDYYPGAARARIMGRQAAFTGVGGLVFLVAGGALADLSWRAPFAIYLVAIALLPLAWRHLDEPSREGAPDASSGEAGTGTPDGGSFATVALLCALAFATMIAFYLTPVQLPFHLETLGIDSALFAGLGVACVTATSAFASLAYGPLNARLGHVGVGACLYALMGAGYGVTMLAGGFALVALGMALFGLGLGLLIPNLNDWMSGLARSDNRGTLLGALTTCLFLGQFLSPLATGPLIDAAGSGGTFGAVGGLLAVVAAGFALRWAIAARSTPDPDRRSGHAAP